MSYNAAMNCVKFQQHCLLPVLHPGFVQSIYVTAAYEYVCCCISYQLYSECWLSTSVRSIQQLYGCHHMDLKEFCATHLYYRQVSQRLDSGL